MASQEPAEWHLIVGETQHAPITLSEVQECIDTGYLTPQDLVWHPTFDDWKRASEVFDFLPPEPVRPPAAQARPQRASAAPQAKPRDGEKRWYQETSNIIGALSLLVTLGIGLLSVPFLSDYWQQNLVGGPLDQYKAANPQTFLSAYEGEWCAEGTAPGIPARVRIAAADADKVKFEFGNIVAPMSIPGSTAEPQFVKTNEGTTKRLLTDGKSAFFAEFDSEIFAGIVTYEQFYSEGTKNIWRRYYIKDNKSDLVFQANLARCPAN